MNRQLMRRILRHFWEIAGAVSVRTKIFGIVLGSTLLLSLGFAVQTRLALRDVLEQKSRELGISIAHDLASRSTDLILINDLYAVHQLLNEARSSFSDVRYAFIVDPSGYVIAHTFGRRFPVELLDVNGVEPGKHDHVQVLETDDGVIWDVAVPIFDGEAGLVRVGISDQSVRSTLARLTTQLSLTVMGVLGVSLLAASFLTMVLTRPILELVDAARSVGRGDFSVQVGRWANDEIGDLAEAFNQMTGELSRMDEIRAERESLRRQLIEGMISAQEEERKRIARELHDSTSQSLTSLKVGLRSLEDRCESPELHEQIDDLRSVLDSTLSEVHNLAVQLRPLALDDLGLEAGLRNYIDEWRCRHQVHLDATIYLLPERLPEAVEVALYRIVQEALTNVARHAQASAVSVLVEQRADQVIAVIEDDGVGFERHGSHPRPHLGLIGIRERAELLGGSLTVETAPGKGTSLFIRIPLSRVSKIDGV